MKKKHLVLYTVFTLLVSFTSYAESTALEFDEVWAYLMRGEEQYLKEGMPISDIAYFSARINNKGELNSVPKRSALGTFPGRVHLVLAEVSNTALLHFVLNPDYPLRNKLIEDLGIAAEGYDGLQIDFENLSEDDTDNLHSFFKALRLRLPTHILSIAAPARTRDTSKAFAYTTLEPLFDKIFIMAYDEHWSGSKAGPVASLGWGNQVASWALQTLGSNKAVMGLPFYGRAWGDKAPGGAYKNPSALRKLEENKASIKRDKDGIPYFTYSETVKLTMYFDDRFSLLKKLNAYKATGIRSIGFWRLGQEDSTIWKEISLIKVL